MLADPTAASKVNSPAVSWASVIVSPGLIATPLSLSVPDSAGGRVVILTPAKLSPSIGSEKPAEKSVGRNS